MNLNQSGFTLIELMIVIAVIGILSAIAIPEFAAYRTLPRAPSRPYLNLSEARLSARPMGVEFSAFPIDIPQGVISRVDTDEMIPG